MKKLVICLFVLSGCSYQPLYKASNPILSNHTSFIVKSKERYGNDENLMKMFLDQNLNLKDASPSSLKLVISIQKTIAGLGINKDLSSTGTLMTYVVNFSLYDKKGYLTSGTISKKSSYSLSLDSYGNLITEEDSSKKLIKSIAESISHIILSQNFKRKVSP